MNLNPDGSLFSRPQLDELRNAYDQLEGINPGSEPYGRLVTRLDTLSDGQLLQLAASHLKFVSGLARNRCVRRGIL